MSSGDALIHGGTGRGLQSSADLPVTNVDHEADEHGNHPGDRQYIRIAVILTVITAIEVAIYYIEALRGILVPLLIVLSVGKFVAVVGYFMHLKFDDRRFMILFAAGLGISVAVITALVIMFWTGEFFPGLPAGPGSEAAH
jgi:cytochrome c oxidase subunit 4